MPPASFWFQEVPEEKRFQTLEGEHRVECAVVGGGIAGLTAAYFLSKAGKKVALLEMGTLGSGDSGYTTAFATHFLDTSAGTDSAWKAGDSAIALFKEIIAAESIDCDWEDVSTIGFSQTNEGGHIRKKYEEVKTVDSSLQYVEGSDASTLVGADLRVLLRKPTGEGQFHIRKFLRGVADAAVRFGCRIFEESEVMAVKPGAPVILTTDKGNIVADHVLVATGAPPSHLFPAPAALLTGAITYVIQATYKSGAPFPKRSLFWDDLEPFHYFRWVSERDIIVGGEDRLIRGARPEGNPHEKLGVWLKKISGASEFEVVNKWQGTIYYTKDYLPLLGTHPGSGENIIFLTGWGGNGMTLGLLGSHVASDMVQGKQNDAAEMFSFRRFS